MMYSKMWMLFAVCCLLTACQPDSESYSINCDAFKSALISLDKEAADAELAHVVADLLPNPTEADPEGHLENFDILIDRLETHCGLVVTDAHYAAFLPLPALSPMTVSFSEGTDTTKRVLSISVPSNGPMFLSSLHE